MIDFKDLVASKISQITGLGKDDVQRHITIPPSTALGDYAFPCFIIAKANSRNPVELAKELSARISAPEFEKVIPNGPYINFFVKKGQLADLVLKEIVKKKKKYGSMALKLNGLIEHTSVNPNASPHVGRARNSIIGDSIARILRFNGYKLKVHYYVNDIGKQIAMLVLACKGKKNLKFEDLLDLYVKINAELESHPEIEQKVFDLLKRLEDGDRGVRSQFSKVVRLCVKGQGKILSELGIKFDIYDHESRYLWDKKTEEVMRSLEKTNRVFVDEQGRYVLNLEGFDLAMKSPVFVLTRGDKTSLYGLRDLAYNIEKQELAGDRNIVVLGEDHKLYFQQVDAALSLIGLKAPEVVHYSFILLESGKMSTRQGNLVLLTEFMEQARLKAQNEIMSRAKDLVREQLDVEQLSRSIGYGALKYHIIKVSPEKNVTFNWESALSFEGDSAPYIQYAHARICSILKKAVNVPIKADFSLLTHPDEVELVKTLSQFPDVSRRACIQLKPHLVASYLNLLAEQFNKFYHSCPILEADLKQRNARLILVSSVRQVLATGLDLIGVDAPKSM